MTVPTSKNVPAPIQTVPAMENAANAWHTTAKAEKYLDVISRRRLRKQGKEVSRNILSC